MGKETGIGMGGGCRERGQGLMGQGTRQEEGEGHQWAREGPAWTVGHPCRCLYEARRSQELRR